MRITFVCPVSDLSGGARVISIYADRLHRRGHSVMIVTRPHKRVTLKQKVGAWLRGRPIAKDVGDSVSHYGRLVGPIVRTIDRVRPITAVDVPDADIVIATWWETAEWVTTFGRAKGKPVYFIQHYEAFPGQDKGRVDATWRLPIPKITIAKWLVDLARDRFGDDGVALVPNAVDGKQFFADPRGKQSKPTVGLMYSAIPFKGVDVSLKAIELAKRDVPDLQVVSFGNEPVRDDLPLPANAAFTLRPSQDSIRTLYAAADWWLVGSRSEGFGLPLLEAMACRTPVIATPTGAAPELVAAGGGVLVPMEDPRAMAAEIVRTARFTESRWRAASDSAYAAATGYTWDDATDRFEAALVSAHDQAEPDQPAAAEHESERR